MRIQIDLHTLERAEERGASETEIREVIRTGFPLAAKYGRQGRSKIYSFRQKRNNIYYEQKKVEVFYAIEKNLIITVTVYVFYGKWEDGK